MGKRGSGPEGPDHEHRPQEIAPSDAAHEPEPTDEPIHVHDSKFAGDVESASASALDQYLPSGPIVYDSGWMECSGQDPAVRVVFVAGPLNAALRNWVRDLVLRPASSERSVSD